MRNTFTLLCKHICLADTLFRLKKISTLYFCLFTICTNIFFGQCGATSKNGSIFSDAGTGPGLVAWTTPPNAQVSDNIRTIASTLVSASGFATTHYLYARNFGFSLPSGAVICGIEVRVEHRQQGVANGAVIKDNSVELISGSLGSYNYAQPTAWSDTDEVYVYGGSSDVWGTGWTPADVNSSGFGVNIATKLSAGSAATTLFAEIDYVYVTLYYGTTLPVEFLSFTAIENKTSGIDLNWSTASEINNDHFVIEKSVDAVIFEPVGTVKGAGNSNQTRNYFFSDENATAGLLYYRLKQVDHNGAYIYSEVKGVDKSSGNEIKIYPCPAQDKFMISIPAEDGVPVEIVILNTMGEKIGVYEYISRKGNETTTLHVNDLENGLYTVKINGLSYNVNRKILVIK